MMTAGCDFCSNEKQGESVAQNTIEMSLQGQIVTTKFVKVTVTLPVNVLTVYLTLVIPSVLCQK